MKAIKKLIFFILFELIFCGALGIYLVYYGPFTNIKDTVVTSAMTSLRHKYLATLFLSKSEINSILKENTSGIKTGKENQSEIKISNNDDNIQITDISTSRFKGYLLQIDNPARVVVGTADNLGVDGMTLGQIIKKYGVMAGVNAGGFVDTKMTGTGGVPSGIIIENGKILFKDDNTDNFSIIGFNDQNILVVGTYSLRKIEEMGIRDAISFGPPLIINGQPMIVSGNGGWGIAPRTAIAQKKDGTVLLLAIDGRQKSSIGATLRDVQDVLLEYGAYNAANLDGGSSTTMYYNGKVVNNPSDILGERSIPSAFIVK